MGIKMNISLLAASFISQLVFPAYALQPPSSGCSKALPSNLSPGGASQNFTLESKSIVGNVTTRRYLAYLPENFSSQNEKAAPLILAFHGQTQPAWSMEKITQLSTPEFNKDAIVVYPEGFNYKSPGQQWLGDPEAPPSSTLDDRIFVQEVLDDVTSKFCVDENRIYATGLSNGGGLTGLIACDPKLNTRFAAFAGVAAAFYADASLTEPLFGAGCDPKITAGRKLPILEFHGLNDSVIAYDGDNAPAPNTIPLPNWVESWVEKNGCSSTEPKVESLDGGNVTEYKWSCEGWKDVVVHRRIDKFGHGWPSTNWQGEPFETLRLGPTTWNATSVILEWLGKWTLE